MKRISKLLTLSCITASMTFAAETTQQQLDLLGPEIIQDCNTDVSTLLSTLNNMTNRNPEAVQARTDFNTDFNQKLQNPDLNITRPSSVKILQFLGLIDKQGNITAATRQACAKKSS